VRKRTAQRPQPLPVLTLDPSVEKQIRRWLLRFYLLMAILTLLFSFLATFLPLLLRVPPKQSQYLVFVAAFALMAVYWSGLPRIFRRILAMGKERLAERRYADAQKALETFDRPSNRNYDIEGEAHYYLVLAHIGMGDIDHAARCVAWLRKTRGRYSWGDKAADALQGAERRLARAAAATSAEAAAGAGTDDETSADRDPS
jgi:hypothetical protein